jgi:hypothetical protein
MGEPRVLTSSLTPLHLGLLHQSLRRRAIPPVVVEAVVLAWFEWQKQLLMQVATLARCAAECVPLLLSNEARRVCTCTETYACSSSRWQLDSASQSPTNALFARKYALRTACMKLLRACCSKLLL